MSTLLWHGIGAQRRRHKGGRSAAGRRGRLACRKPRKAVGERPKTEVKTREKWNGSANPNSSSTQVEKNFGAGAYADKKIMRTCCREGPFCRAFEQCKSA